jgi:CBS domain-containing membrane protein
MDPTERNGKTSRFRFEISDDDIYEAMKEISGYLDITPEDLKEVYCCAYRHAIAKITGSMKARDLMTKPVYSVREETPLIAVAEIMAANEISGIPVVDSAMRIVGIISEKDFCSHMSDGRATSLMGMVATCLKHNNCFGTATRDQKAENIMTSPVITVREDAPLNQITAILAENKFNRIPVLDSEGCLAGIISRADIVRVAF